jgi:hypothetical protein
MPLLSQSIVSANPPSTLILSGVVYRLDFEEDLLRGRSQTFVLTHDHLLSTLGLSQSAGPRELS